MVKRGGGGDGKEEENNREKQSTQSSNELLKNVNLNENKANIRRIEEAQEEEEGTKDPEEYRRTS